VKWLIMDACMLGTLRLLYRFMSRLFRVSRCGDTSPIAHECEFSHGALGVSQLHSEPGSVSVSPTRCWLNGHPVLFPKGGVCNGQIISHEHQLTHVTVT
jgi:hypothetical protein